MQLPVPLPTNPEALEELYQTYCQQEDVDEAELQRLTEARLTVWGIDPQHMTANQIFSAMSESMNSMLMNLYAAQDDAPDDELAAQMKELIGMAEQLREHIGEAMRDLDEGNDK